MIIAIIGIIFLIIVYLLLFWGITKQIQEVQSYKEEISDKNGIIKQLEDKQTFLEMDIEFQEKKIDEKLEYIKQLNENIQSSEEMAIRCQKSYTEILEENYINVEQEYDANQERLKTLYNNLQDELHEALIKERQELDKIRNTRTAAIEAQLREKQIDDNIAFYSLPIDNTSLRDITFLNGIKMQISKPEILNKLIWSTYFQKEANSLCSRIGADNVCGIYKISQKDCKENCYIGQSVNIGDRLKTHIKSGLGIDNSGTNKLYKAMQSLGVWNFTFEVLEKCARDQLDEKEKFYINLYMSDSLGMNVQKGNG
jgi:exonuclease VII large subunit